MLTGIEPVIIKSATGAATRAAGWGIGELRSSRKSRELNKLVRQIEAVSASESTTGITTNELASIGQYLQSPEFDHIAYSVANVLIVQKAGRKLDDALAAIKDELSASLCNIAGLAAADMFTDIVFMALFCAVTRETANFGTQLPPRAQAEAVKVVASIASASARNARLLRESTQSADYLTFEEELRAQIRSLHATMRIPHAGTTRQVPYDQLLIAPRLAFHKADSPGSSSTGLPLERLLKHSMRSVILGDPGGGKSTLALKLAYDIASGNIPDVTARLPLLVVLRDYVQTRTAGRSILEFLNILSRTPYAVTPPKNALEYLLLNGRALVIFDGLDELVDTSLRRDVVQAVEGFAYRYPTTQIVVTSRRVGYEEAPLDSDLFPALQLMELDHSQVVSYAAKWFRLEEGRPIAERETLANSFIRDSEFVADLRVNPLMLSLMCGIYATENYIPRNRPEVYEKCALLLFERWDKQRGIQVPLSFDAHVYAAMRSLALHMYSKETPQMRRQELVNFIKNYLLDKRFDDADIAEAAAEGFIDFCKGRAWVLTDVGEEKYGFTHRTFLEYFSASQLVRLHTSADRLFDVLRDRLIARQWDVVAQLALQILGRTVEDGSDDFLSLTIEAANTAEPLAKANLVLFASKALQFIVPRPDVLRSIITSSIQLLGSTAKGKRHSGRDYLKPSDQAAIHLLEVALELRPEVSKLAREAIGLSLKDNWQQETLLALAVAPWLLQHVGSEEVIRIDWTFWEPWATENLDYFSEYVNLAATRYYWLDVRRVGAGLTALEDLISRHGPLSLFEYQIANYGPNPPFVYEILTMGEARLFGLDYLNKRKLRRILNSLEQILPSIPTPWFRYLLRYRVLFPALEWETRAPKISESIALLFSAPLVELAEYGVGETASTADESPESRVLQLHQKLDGSHVPSRKDERLRDLLGLRFKKDISEEEIASALAAVDISVETASLMRRWILGEISFVRRSRARRSGELE